MKKIGICFIGCGNHANRFVYPALSGLPDAALLAVCSLDPEEAETNRRRHGAIRKSRPAPTAGRRGSWPNGRKRPESTARSAS